MVYIVSKGDTDIAAFDSKDAATGSLSYSYHKLGKVEFSDISEQETAAVAPNGSLYRIRQEHTTLIGLLPLYKEVTHL